MVNVCQGTTKSGKKCIRKINDSQKYCFSHKESIIISDNDNIFEASSASIVKHPKKMDVPCNFCSISFMGNECRKGRCLSPFIDLPLQKNVIGDGYCFWRSLSVNLNSNESKYTSLIETCLKTKEPLEVISKKDVEFWEIPIISRCLNVKINVFHIMDKNVFCYKLESNGLSDSYPVKPHSITKDMILQESRIANILHIPGHYRPIIYN